MAYQSKFIGAVRLSVNSEWGGIDIFVDGGLKSVAFTPLL
jgi:hypothetical protein